MFVLEKFVKKETANQTEFIKYQLTQDYFWRATRLSSRSSLFNTFSIDLCFIMKNFNFACNDDDNNSMLVQITWIGMFYPEKKPR